MTKLTYEQFQEIVDDCINKIADVLQEEGLFDMDEFWGQVNGRDLYSKLEKCMMESYTGEWEDDE